MKIQLALWSYILSAFIMYAACSKRVSDCSSRPGGCFHPRPSKIFAASRSSHQLKAKHARHRVKSTHFGRSSVHGNANSSHLTKDIITMKKLAVEALAKDLIVALIMKEGAIGIHLTEYRTSINEGLLKMENLTKTWTQTSPSAETFLASMSLVLDDLKIGSVFITDDLVRIQKLETDPTHPITEVIRLNYKYNHLQDAYFARDLKDGLVAGTYKENNDLGINHIIQTANGTDETCVPFCYKRIEGSDWWGPITLVREHLMYSDLWMVFLEELNSKLESIESQIEPRQRDFKGEFSRWEGGKNITSGNIMEALDRMNKEYNLYSIKNRISEIVATVNNNRLRYLNEIVRITLKTRPVCSMKSDVAYVTAPYLLMSQVLNCTRYLTTIDSKINFVAIIASVRFYIDDDLKADSIRSPNLELGKGFHLVIISPDWLVVGGNVRTIDLGGRTPSPFSSNTQDSRGGEPGIPGEAGGTLFSFGSYISGGNLTVKLNGGSGGNGQNADYHISFVRFGCYQKDLIIRNGDYCCNIYEVQFWAPGLHGGQAGIGAPAGNYQTFVFNNETQQKFYFETNAGKSGGIGKGSKFYTYAWTWYNSYHNELSKIEQKYGNYWCSKVGAQVSTLPLKQDDAVYMTGYDGKGYRAPSQPNKVNFDAKMSVPAILRYKILSRKHSHLFNAKTIHEFVSKLDLNETVVNLYSTIDLINEFNALGKEAVGGYFNKEILKLSYQSLAVRALALAQNYTGDNPDDNVRVLLFLSSAARSKMLTVSNPYEPILVVNMEDFLAVEKSRVVDLKQATEEQLQYQQITRAVTNYNDMIQKHFEEAAYFIDNTINPEFDAIEMKMGQFTQALLDRIKQLKEDEENNKEILKEQREKLKSHRTGNLFSGILKTIGDVVNVFNPIGGALSAAVDLGNSIANPNPGKPPVKPVQIPEAVARGSSNSALRFRQSTSYSLKGFKRQLEAVKMILNPYRENFPNTFKELESISTDKFLKDGDDPDKPIDDFPPADCVLSFKQQRTTNAKTRSLQSVVKEAIKIDKANAVSEAVKKFAEVATAALKGTASTYNQWVQDTGNIEEISQAITNTDQNIMALQNHIDRIEEEFLPAMDDLFKGLSDARQDLAGQSSIALTVIRHKMQAAIRDAQTDFKKEFVEGTGLEDYFQRGLQSVEDAMGTLITIYERLDAYKEQGKLANFTAEVALNPKYYLEKLNDATLQKKFDELRYTLQGEVILKRQSLVEGAYRMWKFPMVDPVLCSYKNLSASVLNFSTYEEVYKFLSSIETRINSLIEIVRTSKNSILPGDKWTLKSEFKRGDNGYPFYKWENSSSSQFLATLLTGRPTFVQADPFPGPPFCEAVKFSQLFLTFGSAIGDTRLEEELKMVLNRYTVTLIHEGNSNYLFANQTFVITAERIDLDFSFERGPDGNPKIRNAVYDKLLKGDLTLSPYATWGMALRPIEESFGFEALAKFSNKLDMYLEGYGSCVRKNFANEGDYVSPTCEDLQLQMDDSASDQSNVPSPESIRGVGLDSLG